MAGWQWRQIGGVVFRATMLILSVFVITSLSDEGGVSPVQRFARTLPAAPLCAGIAVYLTLARAKAKRELVCLELLGVPSWRTHAPSIAGALLVGTVAAGSFLALKSGVDAFFPKAPLSHVFQAEGDGSFKSQNLGIVVSQTGQISRTEAVQLTGSENASPPMSRQAVVVLLTVGTLAMGLLGAAGRPRAIWTLPGIAATGIVVALQAASAGRVNVGAVLLAVAAFAASALFVWSREWHAKTQI